MKVSTVFLPFMMSSLIHSMQIIPKHGIAAVRYSVKHLQSGTRLIMPFKRFYGDKLGEGEFHPYNISSEVLEFFVAERNYHRDRLQQEQKNYPYSFQDWIEAKEKIKSYKKIKIILDKQIADDPADAQLVLQDKSQAVASRLDELEQQIVHINNSMDRHNAKCEKLKQYVDVYDKILAKIQKKPC